MYRNRAPTAWLPFLFAIVGGVLLARSHWVSGGILVALALGCAAANYFGQRRQQRALPLVSKG
jgi:hypothetical protein